MHMCMFYTLIVVTFLACCYDAATFSAKKRPMPHEYGQIGPILFYKQYINYLFVKLGLVVCSESFLQLADAISGGLAYVRRDLLQVYWEGDKLAGLY